jgi:DNA-binding transcriptional MerR regulator
MRVNEVAQRLDVTPDTVRYYTRIGLLNPSKSNDNGYKNYSNSDLQRLAFILKARHLGFTVAEIEDIVDMSDKGHSPCTQVRGILETHISETKQKITDLQKLLGEMTQAAVVWQEMPDGVPDGNVICDLIELWEKIDVPYSEQK